MTKNESKPVDSKFMLPIVLSTMMNPINSTMLSTALITICNHFAHDTSSGALLITPLYVAATIGQPLMGKLADIYDPKAINRFGLLLVFVATLVGIFAPGFSFLILSRVLLGIGTSAAYPSAMALVSHKYQQVGKSIPSNILGIVTVGSHVSMVIGPLLGGFLTQAFGWQGIFFFNIPWVIVTVILSKNIPSIKKVHLNEMSVFKKVDAIGILFFALFLVLTMIVLTQHHLHWLVYLAVLLSFILFIWWEKKQDLPFIDIRLLWYKPSLLKVYVQTLATNYILYQLLYAMPQWIETVKQLTPSQTGFVMFPMSLMSAASAMGISKIKKLRTINTLAVVSISAASASLFLLNSSIPVWAVVGVVMFTGIATGTNSMANQKSLSVEVPPDKTGVSFGLYRTFGYLGAILSGSQLKTLFKNGVTDKSLHLAGWFTVVSCVVLTVLYFVKIHSVRYTQSGVGAG